MTTLAWAASAPTATTTPEPLTRLRVWDLPTRLFHWSLAVAVGVAIATGLVGGEWMALRSDACVSTQGGRAVRLVRGAGLERPVRPPSRPNDPAAGADTARGTAAPPSK